MHHYTHRRVVRKGKRDGRSWRYTIWPFKQLKSPEPKSDQDIPAQYEVEIIKAAENKISHEAEKWKALDEKLKPDYCEKLSVRNSALKEFSKESEEAEISQREFDTAKQKYEALTMPALDVKWRNFWLLFLAVVEFPLNSEVFTIFGESQIKTLVFASSLCVGIPIFGHFFGQSIRQEYKNTSDKILMITMPIVTLSVLAVLGFIRSHYFEAVVNQHLIGISINPSQMTILFIIINVAIFFIAIIVSYEGSHPDKRKFHTVVNRYKTALKRLEKETAEASEAGSELKAAEKQLQRIRQKRQKSYESFLQSIQTIVDTGEWLVSAYRAANLRERMNIPPCFKAEAQIPKSPQESLILDWNCENVSGVNQT